jgi:hypothetical protein
VVCMLLSYLPIQSKAAQARSPLEFWQAFTRIGENLVGNLAVGKGTLSPHKLEVGDVALSTGTVF